MLHYLERNGRAQSNGWKRWPMLTFVRCYLGKFRFHCEVKKCSFYIYPTAINALKIKQSAIPRRLSLLFPKIQHCPCRVPIPTLVDWFPVQSFGYMTLLKSTETLQDRFFSWIKLRQVLSSAYKEESLCNIRIKNLDHRKLCEGVCWILKRGRPSNILEIGWFMVDSLLNLASALEQNTQLLFTPTSPAMPPFSFHQ